MNDVSGGEMCAHATYLLLVGWKVSYLSVVDLYVGKPSAVANNPDYVPNVFTFSRRDEGTDRQKLARYERLLKRRSKFKPNYESSPEVSGKERSACEESNVCNIGVETDTVSRADKSVSCRPQLEDRSVNTSESFRSEQELISALDEANNEVLNLKQQNLELKDKLSKVISPAARMSTDNDQTHFYTGLPSYAVFISLLSLLSTLVPTKSIGCGLEASEQFLLVLMKLKLAVQNQDLAYRFGIHLTKVSKVFHLWIDVMFRVMSHLISWPDRDLIRQNLPECFKGKYKHTTCIIDCSEVFIERPTSLLARSQTYSTYKGHNTVKFLVAVSPTGAITFVSKCWGGRVSDKYLTAQSGFLHHLQHGDLVLADRGFDIADDLALHGASLVIPPFTKGKKQLSQREVETSRALSSVRIHVERAIGRLKHYKILHSTLPVSLIKRQVETEFATIDKILVICAAISNLHPPLV